MHDLFTKVLSNRDLSKAGDLFSVTDAEIVDDLTDVLVEIDRIISHPDYLKNNNDQSVVEISVRRVLSCICETQSAEQHCAALVTLLGTCLKHNLQQTSVSKEDPPHAKISADIISSIILNYSIYNKKAVMEVVLPVAIKFLQKGNKVLFKNLASYLSLAANEYAHLLNPHVQRIIDSIVSGNHGLCRVLSQMFEVSPEHLLPHIHLLVSMLPRCELEDRLALLQLFALVAHNSPNALEASVSQLTDHLTTSSEDAKATMEVLLKIAEQRPHLVVKEFDKIRSGATATPSLIPLAAQILSKAGKVSEEKSQVALNFVLEHFGASDRSAQTTLWHEVQLLCSTYPNLFDDKVLACVRQKNNISQETLNTEEMSAPVKEVSKTSGGVTIVKLNAPIPAATTHPKAPANTPASITTSGGHVVTIHTSSTTPPAPFTPAPVPPPAAVPTPPHTGYTRRAKLGDSRSTGRLHSAGNTHRSMTRLNIAPGGSVGGLHSRLSSSQQINQQNGGDSSGNLSPPTVGVTPVPPLSSNVIITGQNKWGLPATKITSGGVTVTTSPPPPRIRPHSQGPATLMGSTGALVGKLSAGSALNQSTGSIGVNNCGVISVHHATPAVMTLPINTSPPPPPPPSSVNNEIVVVTSRQRHDNTSVTLLNQANHSAIVNQRMSTFEPYQIMRDTVQQFCEKHFASIKAYMDKVSQRLPPPTRCGIEERRTKKVAKLHFACQIRGPHCLYAKTCFTMRTRNPKTWIHLMFLDFQVRNYVKENCALSTREPGISNLKNIWNILKCENRSFTELVTSNFPSLKEQDALVNELRQEGFLDVFEVSRTADQSTPNINELEYQWGCFLCNHPEKAVGFLHGNNQPMIEGQLKEKKGKWRLFRRWRTRYFTLSGAHLSCKGSSGGESIDVNQIRSVKVSRGARNIPKAFEIFTGDQTLILKPKDGKNAEEWVQCLSIVVAHSQARDDPTAKTNSLPARGLGNSRTAF